MPPRPTPPSPQVHRDLPYAGTKNKRQTLDVYAPTEGKRHPVAFWIHGGGWQAGDKGEVDVKPAGFVDEGYVFVSVNYRLFPEATIKEMAGDVARAMRWVHDHAGDYGGDPDTIFVTGHSAGAQLAALVCTDDRYLKAEGLSLSNIKGCVPVDGDTYDVPVQVGTVEERRARSYRQKFGDEASQKELSPITHVARGKGIPPVPDPPRRRPPRDQGAVATPRQGVEGGGRIGDGLPRRGQEPRDDQFGPGQAGRRADEGVVRVPGRGVEEVRRIVMEDKTFAPGPTPNTVRASDGKVLAVPEGWILLPPGDAGLTRRVKAAGDHWVVQEKVGRRMFSRGVWAATATIERIRAELEAERSTEGYARKQEADSRRREKAQAEYVEDFHGAVAGVPRLPPRPRRPRRTAGPCRHRARHAGRQRDGRQDGDESRSRSGPRPPSSPGCVTGRPATMGWRSRGSRASGVRSGGCSPGVPRSCWAAIVVVSRSGMIAR